MLAVIVNTQRRSNEQQETQHTQVSEWQVFLLSGDVCDTGRMVLMSWSLEVLKRRARQKMAAVEEVSTGRMDTGCMYNVWLLIIAEIEVPGKALTRGLERCTWRHKEIRTSRKEPRGSRTVVANVPALKRWPSSLKYDEVCQQDPDQLMVIGTVLPLKKLQEWD